MKRGEKGNEEDENSQLTHDGIMTPCFAHHG
jgi:hypothetical protein